MRFGIFALMLVCVSEAAQILLSGDSWTGGSRQFTNVFTKYGDGRSISSIGQGGSTCRGWASGNLLTRMTNAVRASDVEHVWFICGGNDAMAELLLCSPQDECVDRMMNNMRNNMRTTIQAVRAANPNVKMVGFGYDLFPFGAIHCNLIARALFTACNGEALCVNNVFFNFQWLYNEMAEEFDNFDSVDVRGACQAAENVPGASIGNPNPNEFSPPNTFAIDCIHPNAYGYENIFDAMYHEYWAYNRHNANNGTAKFIPSKFDNEANNSTRTAALMWQLYLKGLELERLN